MTRVISGAKGDNYFKTNIQMIVEFKGKFYLSSLRFVPYSFDDWLKDGYVFLVAGEIPFPEHYSRSKIRSA